MNYEYKKDTLMHSVGFNLQRFSSVLEHGILSKNKAAEMGYTYTKNYIIKGQNDDYLSMVKVGSVDPYEEATAYKLHTIFGISFIVEDVIYNENKDEVFIHRPDEVLVKDLVPVDKFRGIAIPEEYQNIYLYDLVILPPDLTNYKSIVEISMNYFNFLTEKGSSIDKERLLEYIDELYWTYKALYSVKDEEESEDREELKQNHAEILEELNEFLAEETFICFSNILGKSATLKDVILYLSNNKYLIYDIPIKITHDYIRR